MIGTVIPPVRRRIVRRLGAVPPDDEDDFQRVFKEQHDGKDRRERELQHERRNNHGRERDAPDAEQVEL